MALAHRDATVVWEGSLGGGQGRIEGSGTVVDWAATEADAGETTSPEQLLAAAEASCYAMTLALALTRRGHPADRLTVAASCELDRAGDGDDHEYAITRLTLDVEGDVPGIDEETFAGLARHADEQCPISTALRGNVTIEVRATLAA